MHVRAFEDRIAQRHTTRISEHMCISLCMPMHMSIHNSTHTPCAHEWPYLDLIIHSSDCCFILTWSFAAVTAALHCPLPFSVHGRTRCAHTHTWRWRLQLLLELALEHQLLHSSIYWSNIPTLQQYVLTPSALYRFYIAPISALYRPYIGSISLLYRFYTGSISASPMTRPTHGRHVYSSRLSNSVPTVCGMLPDECLCTCLCMSVQGSIKPFSTAWHMSTACTAASSASYLSCAVCACVPARMRMCSVSMFCVRVVGEL